MKRELRRQDYRRHVGKFGPRTSDTAYPQLNDLRARSSKADNTAVILERLPDEGGEAVSGALLVAGHEVPVDGQRHGNAGVPDAAIAWADTTNRLPASTWSQVLHARIMHGCFYASLPRKGNDRRFACLLSSALARDVRTITALLNDYLRD